MWLYIKSYLLCVYILQFLMFIKQHCSHFEASVSAIKHIQHVDLPSTIVFIQSNKLNTVKISNPFHEKNVGMLQPGCFVIGQ